LTRILGYSEAVQSKAQRRDEIESTAELRARLERGEGLAGVVLQGLDVGGLGTALDRADVSNSIWLGCRLDERQREALLRRGALVFPDFEDLPYDPYRSRLYSVDELMQGYDEGGYTATRDFAIYTHAHRERHHAGGISKREALAQRLHDHAIDDALGEMLVDRAPRGVVGVMGGHGTPRSDPYFRKVTEISRELTRRGYLVVSGGGPGVMEAANLGAWLAGHDDPGVVGRAVELLARADTMSGGQPEGTPGYLEAIRAFLRCARDVVERLGGAPGGVSLAVPTWFYGHEPSNLFSSAVAKYFDNSIREEGLLAIARAGVIYAPGSAGTMQELFQDLTQNHYGTYGARSPMVLLGRQRYAEEHRLIQTFARARGMERAYGDLLALLDEPGEVVSFIEAHPPREVERKPALYELV